MTGSPDDVPRLPPDGHPLGVLQHRHGCAWTHVVGLPLLALLLPLAGAAMVLAGRHLPGIDRETAGNAWFLLVAAVAGAAILLWIWWRCSHNARPSGPERRESPVGRRRKMRTIAPWTIALAALAGCPAPPVAGGTGGGDAGPPPADATTADRATAGVLPAGLYFRNGYLRYATLREWPDPTCAAALGPFADEAAAGEALRRAAPAAAGPGYPLVLHTEELRLADRDAYGIVIVLGLYADAEAARALVEASGLADARVLPLMDYESSLSVESWTAPDGTDRFGPVKYVVRLAPGAAVPAYSRRSIEEMDARRETDAAENPVAPLCTLEPGSWFVADHDDLWEVGRDWAPVRCGDEPAYVPWTATLLETLVEPLEGDGWRMVQVGGVACDVPCFCEWPVREDGSRVIEGNDPSSGCCCPPVCAGGGCS